MTLEKPACANFLTSAWLGDTKMNKIYSDLKSSQVLGEVIYINRNRMW